MTGIIIQARLSSSRLPAKIMLKLPSGRSILEEVVYNCKQSGFKTFVASDSDLFGMADFIGSEDDVWQRYVDCARANDVDVIVRITADSPLVSGGFIKKVVDAYLCNDIQYVYSHNDHDSSGHEWEGYDVEVFSLIDLIWYGRDKEHVTGNLRKHAEKLKISPPNKDGLSVNNLQDYIKVYRMLL